MAEICLECWNKAFGTNDTEKKFVISKELDLCEDCGEWKPVIVTMRTSWRLREWLRDWIEYLRYRRTK